MYIIVETMSLIFIFILLNILIYLCNIRPIFLKVRVARPYMTVTDWLWFSLIWNFKNLMFKNKQIFNDNFFVFPFKRNVNVEKKEK